MNSQFKRGIIELCILKIISRKDRYAYEIIEILSKEIDVNENTVYPILRRLTNDEFFEVYKDISTGVGAPRKFYHLTNKGKEHLDHNEKEWMKFINSVKNIMEESYER